MIPFQSETKRATFLFFTHSFPPRHQLMASFLRLQGWYVSIIIWNRDGSVSAIKGSFDEVTNINVGAPYGQPSIFFKLPAFYLKVIKAIRKHQEGDMLIVTHLLLLPLALFWKGKKIYDSFETYSVNLSFYFGPAKGIIKRLLQCFEGLSIFFFDGVLCIDTRRNWLKSHLRRWNRNVQVIWNLPSLHDDPTSSVISPPCKIYRKRKVIAFVGGIMPEKGLHVVLQAAIIVKQSHPDVLFLLIGPLKSQIEEINCFLSQNYLSDTFCFKNSMPYREMQSHLIHALIGLALYQNKLHYKYVGAGTGRKFFTYMQAGLAIIGPDFGEIGNSVKMADCGYLLNTEDFQAVAHSIVKLLNNPDDLNKYRTNARKAFEKIFNWEKEQFKLYHFINLIGNKSQYRPFGIK